GRPPRPPDVGVRGAPRLLAPRTVLCGPSRPAGRPRTPPRLHPRGVPARDGAPVRRLVGVPGHRLLRADRPVRYPGRLPVPDRPVAPARHPGPAPPAT